MGKVRAELERMEQLGVIAKVEVPTDWCAGMVVVPKPDGNVRICVDLTKLNESVCRERHILPAVDQTLAQLAGAQVFTKLDANSGFWQIPLSANSALLTTFLTPFGRYCFHRLPFGITSAPEHFQRRMSALLEGLEVVVCLMDDILVYGKNQEEHDERLLKVLQRLETAGLTLNREKCKFSQTLVKFLGQMVDKSGVRPDPAKVKAIQEVPIPKNVGDVRRFLGMVNQLGKFAPNLAEKTKALRELLRKDNAWLWGTPQHVAFEEVKKALTTAPVLALYDPAQDTVVSADASSYGLGAVLIQKQPDGAMKPVAYISRSLTPTEQRYAQIEKEVLAFTWACERFSDYLVGLKFSIETDHKPLIPLFSTKNLDELPIRVQRFRMRMMRFQFSIYHVPGKSLIVADMLSRAPLDGVTDSDRTLQEDADAFVNLTLQSLPATEHRLEDIRQHQQQDEVCQLLVRYCQSGWPNKKQLPDIVKPYSSVAAELSVENDLLLRGCRIVIPTALRRDILEKLHTGHQGIVKCRERARQSVWWPGLSTQLLQKVKDCSICCKEHSQPAEPLITSELPELPFQKVGTDLFEWEKRTYLLLVDYYSQVALLKGTTATEVIAHMKSIFARHGIPELIVSDNGPQYSSKEFAEFMREYQCRHITSSPLYPQSNGEAERAVKTIKGLLKKEGDPYLALLSYRATPLQIGYSPSELLMGRKLRTTVPTIREQLVPRVPDSTLVRERDKQQKQRQERTFNTRRRARELSELVPGDNVWVPDRSSEATVLDEVNHRSYEVETSEGTYRRNRRDIVPLPEQPTQEVSTPTETAMEQTETSSRRSTRAS